MNVNDKIGTLSAAQRKKVEARAAELVAEEMTLRELRKTVQAMGGSLSLVAEFPDRPPVVLGGIAEDDPPPKRRRTVNSS